LVLPRTDRQHELVAAPRHGGDSVAAQQLAQREHLHVQVGFFDGGVGPDLVKEIVLAHQRARSLHQCDQQVQRPRADVHQHATGVQRALIGQQLKVSKTPDARH